MPGRSPVRVRCQPGVLGIRLCHWRCEGKLGAAEFISRDGARRIAIVHPSTKILGLWQVSYFADDGSSTSDTLHPSADIALHYLLPRMWRLLAVAPLTES